MLFVAAALALDLFDENLIADIHGTYLLGGDCYDRMEVVQINVCFEERPPFHPYDLSQSVHLELEPALEEAVVESRIVVLVALLQLYAVELLASQGEGPVRSSIVVCGCPCF